MTKLSVRDQLTMLRREMKQLCKERQEWATRAGKAERDLLNARDEIEEWKASGVFDAVVDSALRLAVSPNKEAA